MSIPLPHLLQQAPEDASFTRFLFHLDCVPFQDIGEGSAADRVRWLRPSLHSFPHRVEKNGRAMLEFSPGRVSVMSAK